MIAQTEIARAVSAGSMDSYTAGGVTAASCAPASLWR